MKIRDALALFIDFLYSIPLLLMMLHDEKELRKCENG